MPFIHDKFLWEKENTYTFITSLIQDRISSVVEFQLQDQWKLVEGIVMGIIQGSSIMNCKFLKVNIQILKNRMPHSLNFDWTITGINTSEYMKFGNFGNEHFLQIEHDTTYQIYERK
jgi:hypothetical protein